MGVLFVQKSGDGGGAGGEARMVGAQASNGDEEERDAIIAALAPVADGIVATLGSFCEVVIHDFRRPERSVAAIAGTVTGRSVGGSMSEIGMGVLARGDEAADELNYVTRTQSGKLVKSSTMILRDSAGGVFGALCINLDITAVPGPGNLLGNLLCAVTGLLDGGPLAGLLGQLNDLLGQILDALNLGI